MTINKMITTLFVGAGLLFTACKNQIVDPVDNEPGRLKEFAYGKEQGELFVKTKQGNVLKVTTENLANDKKLPTKDILTIDDGMETDTLIITHNGKTYKGYGAGPGINFNPARFDQKVNTQDMGVYSEQGKWPEGTLPGSATLQKVIKQNGPSVK